MRPFSLTQNNSCWTVVGLLLDYCWTVVGLLLDRPLYHLTWRGQTKGTPNHFHRSFTWEVGRRASSSPTRRVHLDTVYRESETYWPVVFQLRYTVGTPGALRPDLKLVEKWHLLQTSRTDLTRCLRLPED